MTIYVYTYIYIYMCVCMVTKNVKNVPLQPVSSRDFRLKDFRFKMT